MTTVCCPICPYIGCPICGCCPYIGCPIIGCCWYIGCPICGCCWYIGCPICGCCWYIGCPIIGCCWYIGCPVAWSKLGGWSDIFAKCRSNNFVNSNLNGAKNLEWTFTKRITDKLEVEQITEEVFPAINQPNQLLVQRNSWHKPKQTRDVSCFFHVCRREKHFRTWEWQNRSELSSWLWYQDSMKIHSLYQWNWTDCQKSYATGIYLYLESSKAERSKFLTPVVFFTRTDLTSKYLYHSRLSMGTALPISWKHKRRSGGKGAVFLFGFSLFLCLNFRRDRSTCLSHLVNCDFPVFFWDAQSVWASPSGIVENIVAFCIISRFNLQFAKINQCKTTQPPIFMVSLAGKENIPLLENENRMTTKVEDIKPPSDETNTNGSTSIVSSVKTAPLDPNVRHPLRTPWTLWYEFNLTTGKRPSTTQWGENLKEVFTFATVRTKISL